ncbi:MAG: hypothetical protein ABFD81_05595 [Syntrophaceae bacterium]
MSSDDTSTMPRRCLALYSGGLDSILIIKLIASQDIEVIPLYFATPFFGSMALLEPQKFIEGHLKRYGVRPHIIDYTSDFIEILSRPRHGYGKHFNPCIDCKIGMLGRARSLLSEMQAAFVITGEVLGQRPMSQRRDAMNVIERDAGLKGLLIRPLCAQHMQPSEPERLGLVNREALLNISGRGRTIQENLAHQFGLTEIPNPAGGCLLTYAQSAYKVRHTFKRFAPDLPEAADLWLDVFGRKFMLDQRTALVVARNEHECDLLALLNLPGNVFLRLFNEPGPLCILRGDANPANLKLAAGICLRYSKARGRSAVKAAWGWTPSAMDNSMEAPILSEDMIRGLLQDGQALSGGED